MTLQTWTWTLITVVLWGLIPIFDKLALNQTSASPLIGIAIRVVGVTVIAVPLALTVGRGGTALPTLSLATVLLFTASGVASLLLSQYSYYTLLKQADVSRVFPFLFTAAPVVTMLIGVLVLGEHLSLKQGLGAVLVLTGGLLLL